MRSSYKKDDVTILLKDITGLVTPLPSSEREKYIQSGTHYCEMLPLEYEPTEKYIEAYNDALQRFADITAYSVAILSKKIYDEKCGDITLVSLARAGTPIGILIKDYIKMKYNIDVFHYTISIIRGKGIDKNAVNYILKRHSRESIQFVDGWTGKGAIQRELAKAMKEYDGVNSGLAVLSDPAYVADKCGTHKDFLIASSCLNATVSGLISRTFLRSDIIGKEDFHGSAYYGELAEKDVTYRFIDMIKSKFSIDVKEEKEEISGISGLDEVKEIAEKFQIEDINFIKPGIGETTRVLLRRVPWKILVHSKDDHENLGHIYQLANEKGTEICQYPLKNYKACGIIRKMADN